MALLAKEWLDDARLKRHQAKAPHRKPNPEQDALLTDLQRNLIRQRTHVEKLLSFVDAAAGAFGSLLSASEMLDEGVISDFQEAAPTLKSLLKGLREATSAVSDMAKKTREVLGQQSKDIGIELCELEHIGSLETEQRYYADKVSTIEKESRVNQATPAAQERLSRNRAKHKHAEEEVAAARNKAAETAEAFSLRGVNLNRLVVDSVSTTTSAVLRNSRGANTGARSPSPSRPEQWLCVDSPSPLMPVRHPTASNPFKPDAEAGTKLGMVPQSFVPKRRQSPVNVVKQVGQGVPNRKGGNFLGKDPGDANPFDDDMASADGSINPFAEDVSHDAVDLSVESYRRPTRTQDRIAGL